MITIIDNGLTVMYKLMTVRHPNTNWLAEHFQIPNKFTIANNIKWVLDDKDTVVLSDVDTLYGYKYDYVIIDENLSLIVGDITRLDDGRLQRADVVMYNKLTPHHRTALTDASSTADELMHAIRCNAPNTTNDDFIQSIIQNAGKADGYILVHYTFDDLVSNIKLFDGENYHALKAPSTKLVFPALPVSLNVSPFVIPEI